MHIRCACREKFWAHPGNSPNKKRVPLKGTQLARQGLAQFVERPAAKNPRAVASGPGPKFERRDGHAAFSVPTVPILRSQR